MLTCVMCRAWASLRESTVKKVRREAFTTDTSHRFSTQLPASDLVTLSLKMKTAGVEGRCLKSFVSRPFSVSKDQLIGKLFKRVLASLAI